MRPDARAEVLRALRWGDFDVPHLAGASRLSQTAVRRALRALAGEGLAARGRAERRGRGPAAAVWGLTGEGKAVARGRA